MSNTSVYPLTSTKRLSLTNIPDGFKCFEIDTGFHYVAYNQTWFRTDGVNIIGSVFGSPENTLLTPSIGAVGAAPGLIDETNDISMYNYTSLEIITLGGATSVEPMGSIDGSSFKPVRFVDESTGVLFAATAITAVGLYTVSKKFRKLQFHQAGAGAPQISYAHGWI